ncbi:helix-turn-helix domain-containing protein [Streptosporangium saharense]|uniref:helix-turn-helix domain-containing protein n=1 Tax=Streptosporangium saharense TaxID=1706840 RepID=UPI0033293B03
MRSDSRVDEPSFSIWLSQMARARGYPTDASLAEALRISPSTILRWRRGSKPSVTHLLSLSTTLGVHLEGLLVLAGHADAEALNAKPDLPSPPSAITETVRRIRNSSLSVHSKEALDRYWQARLNEERGRLYELIRMLEGAEQGETNVIDDLPKALVLASQPGLSRHLADLIREVTDVLEVSRSRKRRRPSEGELRFVVRTTESGRVTLELLTPNGTVRSTGREYENPDEALQYLERTITAGPDASNLTDGNEDSGEGAAADSPPQR